MKTRIRVTVVTAVDGKATTRIYRDENEAVRIYEECKRSRGLYLFGCIGSVGERDSFGVALFSRWRHFARDIG